MSEAVTPRRNRFLLAQWSELLENDAFRRFWIMRLASNAAINALSYSLLVFTVRASSSAIATGVLLLTFVIPSAMLGAIAGVVVDRLPRGLILVVSNLLRAALAFLLIGAKDSLGPIYAVSLGLGVVTQFTVPAEAAVVPDIVVPNRLTAANSFINLGSLASQVGGMLILAPALLKTTDGDPLLFILMGLFVLSAVLITIIPQFHFGFDGSGQERVTLRVVRREFAEGWLTLSRDPIAYLSLILLVVASTSTLVIATLVPKFSTQVLKVAPENIIFVLAPAVFGVFFGLRSVEWLADRFNKLVTMSVAFLVMAAAVIALGFVPETGDLLRDLDPLGLFGSGVLNEKSARIAATVLYANVYGFVLTMVLTMGRVLLNERIPLNMQGRIFAAQSVLANLSAIIPVVAAGIIADAVGVEPVLMAAGVVAVLVAAWSRARGSRAVPAVP